MMRKGPLVLKLYGETASPVYLLFVSERFPNSLCSNILDPVGSYLGLGLAWLKSKYAHCLVPTTTTSSHCVGVIVVGLLGLLCLVLRRTVLMTGPSSEEGFDHLPRDLELLRLQQLLSELSESGAMVSNLRTLALALCLIRFIFKFKL